MERAAIFNMSDRGSWLGLCTSPSQLPLHSFINDRSLSTEHSQTDSLEMIDSCV